MLTQPEREALIRGHVTYAERLADQIRREIPTWIARDDLVSAAREGLVVAATRYDPTRGTTFTTYAYYRIRGSVFDHLRRAFDGKPRQRAKIQASAALDDVIESTLGNITPTASATPMDAAETLADTLAAAAVAFTMSEAVAATFPTKSPETPEAMASHAESAVWVRDAMANLPERERQMIDGVYLQGMTIADAGATLGVTKGWASRLHARALSMLRKEAEKRDEGR